jgi:hypothetical protein
MTVRARSLVMGVVCLLFACGGGDDDGGGDGMASDLIGPEGGTVTIDGAELVIPPGALDEAVDIAITVTGDAVPAGFLGSSPLYRFEPDGQVFAQPVEARIDFTGEAAELDLIWSTADGTGYQAMGGAVDGQRVVGAVSHFSQGFAGRIDPGGGDECGGCPSGLVCQAGQCVDPGGSDLVACNDGEDNDGDQVIDGDDDGCFLETDESEMIDCSDGVDNDGDGTIDYPIYTAAPASFDTGCLGPTDGSEKPECSDGVDNDSNGDIDLADPQCASADGAFEAAGG